MEHLTSSQTITMWILLAIGLAGTAYALWLRSQIINSKSNSNSSNNSTTKQQPDTVQIIATLLYQEAATYLQRQRVVLFVFIVILAGLAGASVLVVAPSPYALEQFGEAATLWSGIGRAGAFLVGSSVSIIASFVGISLAVASTIRAVVAAEKGYNHAMQIAYRAAMSSGLLAIAPGLVASVALFLVADSAAPDMLLFFAAGSSVVALFLRTAGGMFARSANAQLEHTGKREPDLYDDEATRPTMLASLISNYAGDNAGIVADIAGNVDITFAAALFLGTVLGDMLQGGMFDAHYDMRFVLFPLLVRGVGVLATILGSSVVQTDERRRNARAAMNRGVYVTSAVGLLLIALVSFLVMNDPTTGTLAWQPFVATLIGTLLMVLLGSIINSQVSTYFNPYRTVKRTTLLARMVMGYESNVWGMIALIGASVACWFLATTEPATTQTVWFFYSIALVGLGMLTISGNLIAMDGFGSTTHNAHMVSIAAKASKNVRNTMEDMDEIGNMVKGISRGTIVATANLGSLALLGVLPALVWSMQPNAGNTPPTIQTWATSMLAPMGLVGIVIGAVVPLIALVVLRLATRSTTPPATTALQRSPLLLVIALLVPVLGFALGVHVLLGIVAGAILSVQVVSLFLTTRNPGTPSFKNTAEPSLHALVKCVVILSLLVASLFSYMPY